MKHEAWVSWRLEGDMPSGRYSRAHTLRFDGGAEIAGSPSPDIVPAPYSDASAVDPEEAFVGAISSCHMLWFLDLARRDVRRGDVAIDLTKTEFELLALLMHNSGIVLTREVIYERIWGYDFETNSKSLDVYIGYLRRKTEVNDLPRLIHTVRGVGYTARA